MKSTKTIEGVGEQSWLGLHEVYYDENGKPNGWTEDPAVVVDIDEGVDGIVNILKMMLNDVEKSKDDILDYNADQSGAFAGEDVPWAGSHQLPGHGHTEENK